MTVRVVVDGRPRLIGLVDPRRCVLVVVVAGHERRVPPPSLRGKEPQLVALERTAERSAVVVDVIDGADGGETSGVQIGWNAGAVETVVRVAGVEVPVESVAA